ncbi:uncharacterized protein LOC119688600 [Teleopsis dalmanni]|uniref:uncharacterized protein LOC119688600 n=1 Tax=Teleopsis dalmanni TaxID=139649 RepID=UPI0018CDC8EF|nr:uncharacterized protein LOC119688600 [Teleopsis dalmanni]
MNKKYKIAKKFKIEDAPSSNLHHSLQTIDVSGIEGSTLVKNELPEYEILSDMKMSDNSFERPFRNDNVKVEHNSPKYIVTPNEIKREDSDNEYEDVNSTSSDCEILSDMDEVYSVSSSDDTISGHSSHYEMEHNIECEYKLHENPIYLIYPIYPIFDNINYFDDMCFTSGLENIVEYSMEEFEKCTRRSQEIVLQFYSCMKGDRTRIPSLYDKSCSLIFDSQKFDGVFSIAYFYLNLPKTEYQILRVVCKLTNEVITLCGFAYEVRVTGTLEIGEEASKWFRHRFIIAEYEDRCRIVYEELVYFNPVLIPRIKS